MGPMADFAKQSQLLSVFNGHTFALTGLSEKSKSPSLNPCGTQAGMPVVQGPSEVFRIVMTRLHQTRNSATESIPASLTPLRAPVGSNTETDDDCRPATFHREAFGAKAPFSIQQ
jgi:hypothetical protein